MKKIRLILMVLVLALSVIACGKEADSDSTKNSNKISTKSKGVSKEILDAAMYEQVIQIGNTVLYMPFTLQDVLDAGATIQDNKYTPDYIMNAGDEVYIRLSIGDGEVVMYFQNISDTTCSLKDAIAVGGAELGTQISSSSIYLPGGIHVGSTLEELQSAWGAANGETSTNESFTYSYYEYFADGMYAKGDSYKIAVDRNTAKVKSIKLEYTLKLDKIVETVYDYGRFKLIIPVPYYAKNVSIVDSYTIETIDGVDYVINYPIQAEKGNISNVDYSPTEEALNSVLTASEYVSIKDPIEQTVILKNDDNIGIICAFYNSSETGKYTCRTYLVCRGAEYCPYSEASVDALNGEAISENAKQYFIDNMKEIMSGCDCIMK